MEILKFVSAFEVYSMLYMISFLAISHYVPHSMFDKCQKE